MLRLDIPANQRIVVVQTSSRLTDGDNPCIEWCQDRGAWIQQRSRGCLRKFTNLSAATDQQIYDFSREWGILDIEATEFKEDADPNYRSDAEGEVEHWKSESLELWRLYSRTARAIIRLHDKLRAGDSDTSLYDWGALFRLPDPSVFTWPTSEGQQFYWEEGQSFPTVIYRGERPWPSLDLQRNLLEAEVARWFRESRMYPSVTWDGGEMKLGIAGYRRPEKVARGLGRRHREEEEFYSRQDFFRRSEWDIAGALESEFEHADKRPGLLFLNLTLEIAAALSRPEGTYQCNICGEFFWLETGQKAPSSKRNNYCRKECQDEAHRLDMKRYYYRKKAGGNLPSTDK